MTHQYICLSVVYPRSDIRFRPIQVEKETIVYIPKMEELELMYKLFDAVTDSIEQLISLL